MPVNLVESRPNVYPPAQSVEARNEDKIKEINITAQQASGIDTPQPVHQEGQKIVIEVKDTPTSPEPIEPTTTSTNPGYFSKLSTSWEHFTNWRRTFLMNRFGTTKSKQGLDASMERAVDKAEDQGQEVTNIQK